MAKTADEFLSSEGWKKRIEGMFDRIDVNKNGSISKEEVLSIYHKLKAEYNDSPHLEACRKLLEKHCDESGLGDGKKITKDEFVSNHAKFAACAHAKLEEGGGGNSAELSHAIIDVIASDKSHDGNVTLEEYRKVVKMLNLDEQKTDDAFRRMDPSNSGKIGRKQILELQMKFITNLQD